MCEWKSDWSHQVPMPINGRVKFIDSCIAHIVAALNAANIHTVASCCGHGHQPGSIILDDGKELIIAPDWETARKIESYFPNIHGEKEK